MRRTSSVCRVSHPTSHPTSIPAGSSSTATKMPINKRAQSDDTDPHDSADIPRRESLHKPTWQYNIPGQSQPSTDATNAPSKSINVTSDSDDEDDEYLRRPSIVKHHHYYQEKEVQQQLQLPTKPLQQLRRTSLHGGVCFKSTKNSGNTKIARHHTIASADLKPTADSNLTARRRSSLTHSTQSFGSMMHNTGELSRTGNAHDTTAACHNFSRSMDGATFCRQAGRALMQMVSLGTQPNVQAAPTTSNVKTYAIGEEEYDIMGKVIMLGDSGVGKTCLLIRFYDGKYMPHYYITTVGIDYRVRNGSGNCHQGWCEMDKTVARVSFLTLVTKLWLWMAHASNCKFGTQLVRSVFAASHIPIIAMPTHFYFYMTSPIKPLTTTFALGWARSEIILRTML
ncbi:uncharacterized protein Rab26 isoform X3 [Bactrocera oleae]|uniref:uncharacterized protein Rab26 isoform X3 n=1 Tax=Bactrocera oleae TaxID=104688 RepID=UPI00387EB73A